MLLLLIVFITVNAALVRLKITRPTERGQFEVPLLVPIIGGLVCAILVLARVSSAITSADPASRTAPLIAGAIVLIALGLFRWLKPSRAVLVE